MTSQDQAALRRRLEPGRGSLCYGGQSRIYLLAWVRIEVGIYGVELELRIEQTIGCNGGGRGSKNEARMVVVAYMIMPGPEVTRERGRSKRIALKEGGCAVSLAALLSILCTYFEGREKKKIPAKSNFAKLDSGQHQVTALWQSEHGWRENAKPMNCPSCAMSPILYSISYHACSSWHLS